MVALLVDDEPDGRKLLAAVLMRRGWEVVQASDGAEALTHALATPPDIVITDIDMPNMNGVTLCERLRSEPSTKHVPVLVVTGGDLGGAAISAGCDVVLEKPCAPHVLLETVQRLVADRS